MEITNNVNLCFPDVVFYLFIFCFYEEQGIVHPDIIYLL